MANNNNFNQCLTYLLDGISCASRPVDGKARRLPCSLSLPTGVMESINDICTTEGRSKTSVFVDALTAYFLLLGKDLGSLGVTREEAEAIISRISYYRKGRLKEEESEDVEDNTQADAE